MRNGLTADEAAKKLGVHVNSLLRWENGTSEPMGQNLIDLAKLYNCTPEYLLKQADKQHEKAIAI